MKNKHKHSSKRKFIKNCLIGSLAASCSLYDHNIFASQNYKKLINISNSANPDEKHKIEALYYVPTPKGLKCQLCPNECKIKINEEGECRTRINRDNILECIAYGNPCAVHIDPIEKKPLYHFLPGSKTYSIATAGCNLACLNCQNWEISQTSPLKTRNYDLMPKQVVEQCIKNECSSIAYTYSDPVVFYEYVLDTSIIARENGIKNVIVSAGYIHEKPLREWCRYIDGANIDLKSFSNEIYEMLNAGSLEPVLNTLRILKEEGIWIEITNLIVPNWTDDMVMLEKMCKWLYSNGFSETPLHFSRFFPLFQLTDLPSTPLNTLQKAKQIAQSNGIKYVYIGNAPENGPSITHCPECHIELIVRKGYKIIQNNLFKGTCLKCKSIIDGIWQ